MTDNNDNKPEAPSENHDAGKADEIDPAFLKLEPNSIALVLQAEGDEGFHMSVFDNVGENKDSPLPGLMRAIAYLIIEKPQVLNEAFLESINEENKDWTANIQGNA